MKLRSRIAAAMTAVVMASSMMMTSASAETWSVYKKHDVQGRYMLKTTSSTYLSTPSYNRSTCQVNCTSFSSVSSYDQPDAHAEYWTFVSSDASGSRVLGSGFSRKKYYDKHEAYVRHNLSTTVYHGEYLQCRVELIDYQYVMDCSMSGNFIW